MEKTRKLIEELKSLINDIRVEKIAPHIEQEALWNWCGVWRQTAEAVLEDLESEVLDERNRE